VRKCRKRRRTQNRRIKLRSRGEKRTLKKGLTANGRRDVSYWREKWYYGGKALSGEREKSLRTVMVTWKRTQKKGGLKGWRK